MFGLSIRAAAEDFDAARLMGVQANRVISGAFAFAGLLAGIAGALCPVAPRSGRSAHGRRAAAEGGHRGDHRRAGQPAGAVVGGLALGVAEVFFRSWLPSDLQGLTDASCSCVIAVLFIVRPQGLFNVQTAERV